MHKKGKKVGGEVYLSLQKVLKKCPTVKTYHLIIYFVIGLSLIGVVAYQIGSNDGYAEKEFEIKQLENQQNIENLMTWELKDLAEHSGKLVLSWLIVHSFWLKAFVFIIALAALLKVLT